MNKHMAEMEGQQTRMYLVENLVKYGLLIQLIRFSLIIWLLTLNKKEKL